MNILDYNTHFHDLLVIKKREHKRKKECKKKQNETMKNESRRGN